MKLKGGWVLGQSAVTPEPVDNFRVIDIIDSPDMGPGTEPGRNPRTHLWDMLGINLCTHCDFQ